MSTRVHPDIALQITPDTAPANEQVSVPVDALGSGTAASVEVAAGGPAVLARSTRPAARKSRWWSVSLVVVAVLAVLAGLAAHFDPSWSNGRVVVTTPTSTEPDAAATPQMEAQRKGKDADGGNTAKDAKSKSQTQGKSTKGSMKEGGKSKSQTQGKSSKGSMKEGGMKSTTGSMKEGGMRGETRTYYIAAEEVDWDYRPAGPLESGMGDVFLLNNGRSTIGSVYRKAHYVEYTDATFSIPKEVSPEWAHLGLVGPVLRAAVGDELKVVFQNKASFPYTMHPHGVFYDLDSEGAEFPGWDNTNGYESTNGAVEPGKTKTYRWGVPQRAGPQADGPSSIAWFYYSHADATADTNSGLVGVIIVGRDSANRPSDVDREFVLYVSVTDESKSHYLEENSAAFLPGTDMERLEAQGELGEFEEGNLKHGINFRLYDNLAADLTTNIGEKVRIYVLALGTEVDMHTIHWHGIAGSTNGGQHTDTLNLLPSSCSYLDVVPDVAGDWALHCHVNDHIAAGMMTHLHVKGLTTVPSAKQKHTYYIAVEEVDWDYRPLGPIPSGVGDIWLVNDVANAQIGSVYRKAQFVQYTDASFTERKPIHPDWAHLGLVGPVLRAAVGDEIEVVFRNKANFPYTMHPHGVFYDTDSEGASWPGIDTVLANRAPVPPGETKTYHWFVPDRAGPSKGGPSSMVWMYHSHANEVGDTSAGLVGAIIITAADTPVNSDGRPMDVDREFVLFFTVTDETLSQNYIAHNVATYLPSQDLDALLEDSHPLHETFEEANLRHGVNFRMFDDLAAELKVRIGEKVRIYVMALGTEVDMHTIHWHGMTGVSSNLRKDVLELMPASCAEIDIVPDVAGDWPLHCHVNDHMEAGMLTHVHVDGQTVLPKVKVVRQYFIAAEEVQWNYCPVVPASGVGDVWCVNDVAKNQIGSTYTKAQYIEYTDATFTTRKARAPEWKHLGLLGPVLRAQVGDLIQVTFKNQASFPYTMHPHGVFYDLDSEGSQYVLGLNTKTAQQRANAAVLPGAVKVYKWFVPERAGPAAKDGSSMVWLYHSHSHETMDTNSGLVGGIIITRAGEKLAADGSGRPADVDREFMLYLSVVHEHGTHYIAQNVQTYLGVADTQAFLEEHEGDKVFEEGNLMHSINFYLFDNVPEICCQVGDRVRVYVLSLGTEVDIHTLHFHGMTGVLNGQRTDIVELLPASMFSIDITPDQRGKWPVHCHVNDHIEAGMGAHLVVN